MNEYLTTLLAAEHRNTLLAEAHGNRLAREFAAGRQTWWHRVAHRTAGWAGAHRQLRQRRLHAAH